MFAIISDKIISGMRETDTELKKNDISEGNKTKKLIKSIFLEMYKKLHLLDTKNAWLLNQL